MGVHPQMAIFCNLWSDSDFNPQNTLCIPAVKIFVFLDLVETIDFQILNFTRPEGGIRVSRTFSTSSRIPTDNAVKFNIWKPIIEFQNF